MPELKVLYKGPRTEIMVDRFGSHLINEIKPYPDQFARELVASSNRQHFELVGDVKAPKGKKQGESPAEKEVKKDEK